MGKITCPKCGNTRYIEGKVVVLYTGYAESDGDIYTCTKCGYTFNPYMTKHEEHAEDFKAFMDGINRNNLP